MAPSIAMVNAGASNSLNISKLTSGIIGTGIEAFISPKRLPMVSTGSSKTVTAIVVPSKAIKVPGNFLLIFGHNTDTSTVNKPIPSAYKLTELKLEK
jgi:hypothetical protein